MAAGTDGGNMMGLQWLQKQSLPLLCFCFVCTPSCINQMAPSFGEKEEGDGDDDDNDEPPGARANTHATRGSREEEMEG